MSPGLFALLVAVLAALSMGLVAVAVLYPTLAARAAFDRRLAAIAETGGARTAHGGVHDEARRRQQALEKTLRQLEASHRRGGRRRGPSLAVRLRQADLDWSPMTYLAVCVAVGLAAFAAAWIVGLGPLPAGSLATAAALLVPRKVLDMRRAGRFRRFGEEFPGAVDVIVRGIRSGLPLGDCLNIISHEVGEPVRSEFRHVVDDQMLGVSVGDAVQRMADRVPVTEARFFAIVIAIQARSGGNLSEALSNLSKVMRERKRMEAKIKSMSAEAKASGMIIASLPIAVGGITYLASRDYIMLLFTTLTGQVVLGICATWMLIGVLVMRNMIRFDF